MKRYQKDQILQDLKRKMVLLVGPRQSGKTWLAKDIAKEYQSSVYLNYDSITDREIILKQTWLPSTELLILDELHKMPDWKNYLKGLYDTKLENLQILVTGSARLDVYDNLGDSLAGRYFRHRLLPFSLAELQQVQDEEFDQESTITKLISCGGFPEPFLLEDEVEIRRWRDQYINSLLSTDVFEIDQIQSLKTMRTLFELLRARVSSPVSLNSLAEDLQVSFATVSKYVQTLEALFVVFRVTPYSKNIARSLLKEAKIYFFDTALVNGDEGAKFENLIAVSLLKHCYAKNDILSEDYKLHYLRTKDKQEVDFALVKANELELMIEAKYRDADLSAALKNFHKRYEHPAMQVVQNLKQEFVSQGIEVRKASSYLASLFL